VLGVSSLGYFIHCACKATIYMPCALTGNVDKSTLLVLVIIKADYCVYCSATLVLVRALGRVMLTPNSYCPY
jgi:hypothetical protein